MLYLEEYTYNRGKIAFDSSQLVKEVIYENAWERMLEVQKSQGVNAFIISHEVFPEAFYRALNPGTLLVRLGVGYDSVPIELCKELGILVANTPNTLNQSVAEHAMVMLASFSRHIIDHDKAMRKGGWAPQMGEELSGKTLAIIGFGVIGRSLAKIAKYGYGMKVVAFGRNEDGNKAFPDLMDRFTTNLETAVKDADFVSIHLSLSTSTAKIINYDLLKKCKKNTVLVNTARGGVIDEEDLYRALVDGTIYGACLDVFAEEPYFPIKGNDLRELPNVVLSPHVASHTVAANMRMAQSAMQSIKWYEQGEMEKLPIVSELKGLVGKKS
ncbi:MAG: NAD(P)-binding domain-containing protein [Peptostreptococcaceae bacterium]|nr:NAD(P)-binding domain-containing protein [Peptostreptococcaceae bacterium]